MSKSFCHAVVLSFILWMYAIPAQAQSGFFYRSLRNGDWHGANTWERSSSLSGSYDPTSVAPTDAAKSITILNGHTVTISANIDIDETIVESGGILKWMGGAFISKTAMAMI